MYQVIIIEDDPMVAAIDKQYVEADSQFRVVRTFKSGGEALAHLPKLKADLIILDYYTPGMNGTEFVDQLHTLGESPFIIAVTSANDTHIVQGLLARGVLDYLVKPFQFPRFRQALDRFLQARRLLEQGPGSMDQSAIDQLVHHREALPPGTPLDKGVNFSTLSRSTSLPANRSPNMWACPVSRYAAMSTTWWIRGRSPAPSITRPEAAPPSAT